LFLKGVQFDDEIEDEICCQKLYEDYLNDPDPEKDETYTLEECKKEWGIDVSNYYQKESQKIYW